uniref:E3 ubiquitin-protein ligase PPP1R11 n=1 Tax=Aceria tosichella TaxID=561515 RepID=A0A6G1SAL6_9ACAR
MTSNAPPRTTSLTATATTTTTLSGSVEESTSQPTDSTTVRLKKKQKKVAWNQDTVDNEGLGRKSSKCCCIYQKPHKFDESSSDSELDDCDHCRGHVEKRSNLKSA